MCWSEWRRSPCARPGRGTPAFQGGRCELWNVRCCELVRKRGARSRPPNGAVRCRPGRCAGWSVCGRRRTRRAGCTRPASRGMTRGTGPASRGPSGTPRSNASASKPRRRGSRARMPRRLDGRRRDGRPMPRDPFRPSCLVAGCAAPVASRGRCRRHAEAYDRQRGLDSDRRHRALYASPAWRETRRRKLAACPWCACGCGQRADVVHHVRPHGGNPALFFAESNLATMAKRCHDKLTATDGGRGPKIPRGAASAFTASACGVSGVPFRGSRS